MPTTRNRWQAELQDSGPSLREGGADEQANEAADSRKRQPGSPLRPSVSPAPEFASDLHHDPSPRSPKRHKPSDPTIQQPLNENNVHTILDSANTEIQVPGNIIQRRQSDQTGVSGTYSASATIASRAQITAATSPSLNTEPISTMQAQEATQVPIGISTSLPPSTHSNSPPPPATNPPTGHPQYTGASQQTPTRPNAPNTSIIPASQAHPEPSIVSPSQTSTLAALTHPSVRQAISKPSESPQTPTAAGQDFPPQTASTTQTSSTHNTPITSQQAPTPSTAISQPAPNQSASGPHQQPPQHTPGAARPPSQPSSGHARPAVPPPPSAEAIAELNKSRVANVGALGELAGQILLLLSKMPVVDAMGLSADINLLANGQQPLSPAPAEYQRLRILFDPIRNLYLTNSPFLIAEHLKMTEPLQVETFRKANQAMFCSAIFAGGIGQLALDQSFLDVFVPQHGKLLKSQAGIWLELKTQGFLTAMRLKAAPPNQVMHDLFPVGIEGKILARRPGSRTLAPSEQDFVNRFESRKRILLEHVERNALPELEARYLYSDLGKEVTNYLIKNHARSSNTGLLRTISTASMASSTQGQMQGRFSIDKDQIQEKPSGSIAPNANLQKDPTFDDAPSYTDISIEEIQRMCKIAMKEAMKGTLFEEPDSEEEPADEINQTTAEQSAFQPYKPLKRDYQATAAPPVSASNNGPQTVQSIPTHVLYQQARLVVPKSPPVESAESSMPGSQPQPWTDEEEKALMDGIDQVRGPHWSQILALHGPGGSSTEALKNRNQVQLKDKARNLKLFFLKSNIGVPPYLSQVTGTLEPRGEKAEAEITRGAGSLQDSSLRQPVKIEEPSMGTLDSVQADMISAAAAPNEGSRQPLTTA